MKRLPLFIPWLAGAALLVGLPLFGAWLCGRPLAPYLEMPPRTSPARHADFSWPVFAGLAVAAAAAASPFLVRMVRANRTAVPQRRVRGRFPWWGWLGLAGCGASWLLAWTRFPWFAHLQPFTFTPLWLSATVALNALVLQRTGTSPLTRHPLRYLALFPLSAAFWWFFEYLNRFVQNWHYAGIGALAPWQYFLFATLPFSTVLPAVMSTAEWLATFPRWTAGLDDFLPVAPAHPRRAAGAVLLTAGVGLAGIGVFPDLLFPLLWVSPLAIIVALQTLAGRRTVVADVARGDWRRVVRLALASLVCGVFWELWNYHSLAKWIYTVPYVNRFRIFEMPVLGYAGYLPFGLECAVIAELAERFKKGAKDECNSRIGE